MTEPICNDTNRAPWTDAAEQTVGLNCNQLDGPSGRTLEAQYRMETRALGIGGTMTSGAQTLLGEYGATVVGGTLGGAAMMVAGPGATLLQLLEGYAAEVHHGVQMNEAHRRDAVNLVVTCLANQALPADFVADRLEQYGEVGHSPGQDNSAATRMLTRIAAGGRFDEAQQLACSQANAGRDAAQSLGIDSQEALQARLGQDPTFATQYNDPNSLALRLGVDSVIWQAQHPAAPRG
jgi:hypothetical protein